MVGKSSGVIVKRVENEPDIPNFPTIAKTLITMVISSTQKTLYKIIRRDDNELCIRLVNYSRSLIMVLKNYGVRRLFVVQGGILLLLLLRAGILCKGCSEDFNAPHHIGLGTDYGSYFFNL